MKRLWKITGLMVALAMMLNLIIELLSRKSLGDLANYIMGKPGVFILNGMLLALPFLLVLFVKRKVFLTALLFILGCTMGVINGVLLVFRTTPFTAADFLLVKYALGMITLYLTWWQILLAVLSGIVTIALFVYLWRKAPVDKHPISLMDSVCVSAVMTALIWGGLNFAIMSGSVALHFGNIGQAFKDYGFSYCFANTALNTGIPKPEDYDSEVVAEVYEEALVSENTEIIMEKTMPNIIMVQLESFFDPELWMNNPVKEDPISFFRFLKGHFPSGYLSVPSVGAGTANTEFECLTGMNLDFFGPGEYPYKTVLQKTACESLAFDMKELGYKTHAIHNNEATFYDRHKVFAQLGFDTFTPIEYMYNVKRNPTGWCKDSVLVEEIEKTLDSSLRQDLVYAISVQGHGKYPSFEYYCEQIGEMDLFLSDLITMLIKRDEPTVLVLYGDHLPGFEWTKEEMENDSLFQTEYVIWNNMDLPVENKDIESYQLAAHVLNLLDIHEGTMMRFHQRHLNEGENQDYLNAMELLEYDILYGAQEVYGGESPYKATKMEFGIEPIIQGVTWVGENQIIVFGENFNSYSKICVDGKPVETPYYRENRLIATGLSLKGDEEITVMQVGRDRVGLGTARRKVIR